MVDTQLRKLPATPAALFGRVHESVPMVLLDRFCFSVRGLLIDGAWTTRVPPATTYTAVYFPGPTPRSLSFHFRGTGWCNHIIHGRRLNIVATCTPITRGRIASGFHWQGRHCLGGYALRHIGMTPLGGVIVLL